jgi:hypothetical protein
VERGARRIGIRIVGELGSVGQDRRWTAQEVRDRELQNAPEPDKLQRVQPARPGLDLRDHGAVKTDSFPQPVL